MRWAMVFPGQGSQSVGMLQDFYTHYRIVRDYFERASDVMSFDLWSLIKEGPADKLNETTWTQPALLVSDAALWACWSEQGGPQPDGMAGHSLGEFSALVCANAMTLEDAVRVVVLRGQAMQEAVPLGEGAMAAVIGASDADVDALCQACAEGEVLVAANYNSTGQVVISGHRSAIVRAVEKAPTYGARKAVLLSVSGPFHSPLMQPAADRLAEKLNEVSLSLPAIPVWQNVSAGHPKTTEDLRTALIDQVTAPVRWVETVESMRSAELSHFVECGPGKVLSGLIKRIDKAFTVMPLSSLADFDNVMETIGERVS